MSVRQGAQNVWQSGEGLPDILSGMSGIIFAITVGYDSEFFLRNAIDIVNEEDLHL